MIVFPITNFKSSLCLENFRSGNFDFDENLWLDKSGNDNHLILKSASARTGNGENLDFLITGLLTSDVITVETGSDIPTIPINGTLRIGASQIVYGITIKRSEVIWAIISFCEPKINENMPTISYDVSGNGHHATCDGLVDGNITTQNNYFYLQKYGFSIGAANVLGWDTTQWTGSIDDYTALFDGVVLSVAQDVNKNIRPTPDGLGCRFTRDATHVLRLRKYNALIIGKRFRFKIRIENFTAGGVSSGLVVTNLGIITNNRNWIVGNGDFDYSAIAVTSATFQMSPSNNLYSSTIDFYSPTLQLEVIVPAQINTQVDAIGNVLEYIPDDKTLFNYTCELQAPSSLILTDQKGYWSDYINQGYCVNGKNYLIEKTETNHFGVGKIVFDEFVADGTEVCDDNNEVRELILHNGERGFFFDDDNTSHLRSYDDFVNIKPHFVYCSLLKDEELHVYYPTDPDILPPQLYNSISYGWKKYCDKNKLYDLVIIKSDVYLTDMKKVIFNNTFVKTEEPTFGMISFIFDSWVVADYQNIINVFEDKKFKLTRAIYYSNDVTKTQTDVVLASGHEIIAHTPKFDNKYFDSYKGFQETDLNYSELELRDYYQDVVDYMRENRYNNEHKILPGGDTSVLTQSIALDFFKSIWLASGSEKVNRTPIIKYENMGRYANDYINATAVNDAKNIIDTTIANKGWAVFYSHSYSFSEDSLVNMSEVLDYITTKIANGEPVRVVKMEDAYNILKKH